MYNTEQFLVYASKFLNAKVSQESIDQVRDTAKTSFANSRLAIVERIERIIELMISRITDIYPQDYVIRQNKDFPDILRLSHENNERVGYEIMFISHPKHVRNVFQDAQNRAYRELYKDKLDKISIIILSDSDEVLSLARRVAEDDQDETGKITLYFMLITIDEDGQIKDIPF